MANVAENAGMAQVRGFLLWAAPGWKAKLVLGPVTVDDYSWYVIDESSVLSGPHASESLALRNAERMTDTSGT